MLNQKQFGCLKFLSVNFNDTQVCKGETSKKTTIHNLKRPADKRHPGHRSRYGKYGPRSGCGFLRTACQPIRIENFEKPYNNAIYSGEIMVILVSQPASKVSYTHEMKSSRQSELASRQSELARVLRLARLHI